MAKIHSISGIKCITIGKLKYQQVDVMFIIYLTPNNPQIHQHIKSRAIKLYNIRNYFYDFRVGKDFINVL